MWFWPNIHEIPTQAFVGPGIENNLGFPTKKGFWSLRALIQKHVRCLLLLRANSKHNVSTNHLADSNHQLDLLWVKKTLQRTTSILVIRDLNSRTPRLSFSVCTTTTKRKWGLKWILGTSSPAIACGILWLISCTLLVYHWSHSALTFSTINSNSVFIDPPKLFSTKQPFSKPSRSFS